jgi:DNA-binding FrmR family transcriptional regulator
MAADGIESPEGGNAMKESDCCRKRAVPRSAEERTRLVNRLNRIEGQIRGIRGMVENDLYCNDILVQCSAVNAALNAFERELLASHVRSCVADALRAGKDEVVDELLETLKRMMK